MKKILYTRFKNIDDIIADLMKNAAIRKALTRANLCKFWSKVAGEKFAAAFGRRAISLAGRLSFSESAAAVEMASLYIGNDTGLMHVAAALKKPVLSVNCFPLDVKMGYLSVPLRFVP